MIPTNTNELKPCPFCGAGSDRILRQEYTTIPISYIECSQCGAQVRSAEGWNRRANDWQPIETAPKDGTKVLIYTPVFPGGGIGQPTHWMPWPEGPLPEGLK